MSGVALRRGTFENGRLQKLGLAHRERRDLLQGFKRPEGAGGPNGQGLPEYGIPHVEEPKPLLARTC